MLAPNGELDLATVDPWGAAFYAHSGCYAVVWDLPGVSFMVSAGLPLVR